MSPQMHLPNSPRAFIQSSVYGCRHGQRTSYDRAHAGQEAREGFRAGLAVDDFHGGNVL